MQLDFNNGVIEMAHGSGGRAMSLLIDQLFVPAFANDALNQRNDQAVLTLPPGRLALATDSHVVSPLFFPGGDIGSLAVNGSVNDVAMSGAQVLHLAVSFILEEGLPLSQLKRITDSMAEAARLAGVQIVTGDTKVVERGKADGVFITTTGTGVVPPGVDLGGHRIAAGDHILVSGSLGDHGAAILSQREGMSFQGALCSDTQSLSGLVSVMLEVGESLHCLRDPTRGGVAATLNELMTSSGLSAELEEASLPVKEPVNALSELLGLDPLYIANEGKLLAFCAPDQSSRLLEIMRRHPQGEEAAIIGKVGQERAGQVVIRTALGGARLIDWRYSDPLPRIC